MISFQRFLFESSFVKKDFPDHKGVHSFIHETDINGHRVKLSFDHNPSIQKGHYTGSFSINGHINRNGSDIDPTTRNKIGMHILHKTHEFIKTINPVSMDLMAADGNRKDQAIKSTLYGKIAKHLAKKFGGKAIVDPITSFINFRKNG